MADNSNRYGRNQNLWRRFYGTKKRKPIVTQVVDEKNHITRSLNLQELIRHRDFFSIKGGAFAPLPSNPALIEYDEGLVAFNYTTQATSNFNFCFSNTPDAVVLTTEPAPDFSDYVIPFGLTFNSCSMSIGVSAPFTGSVRYRAVYSNVGYPAFATSSFVPASGVFRVSAGNITASMATTYVVNFPKPRTSNNVNYFAKTPWDFFGNFDNDVYLTEDTYSFTEYSGTLSGNISATLTNPIYWMVFF